MTGVVTWTCTGCSLLCDDISVSITDGKIETVEHACLIGKARIFGCKHTAKPTVDHTEVDINEAIAHAAHILTKANNPVLYGWSNSTSKAQLAGIELAQILGCVIDSTSSFCQGITINEIIKGNIATCTLEEVREMADVIVYWGTDPMSSHPRHLSRYSYFPRGEMRQHGYEEDRKAIAIDVRRSRTAKICSDMFFCVPPAGDLEFMKALMDAVTGKVPSGTDVKKVLEMAAVLKKAEFGVIFAGLGLVYSIKNDFHILSEFMNTLNKVSDFSLIPMVGHFNARGFNHNLYNETGYVHRVKFSENGPLSGVQYSVMDQIKNEADAVLVVGSDPLGSFPAPISDRLRDIPVILIDPCKNLTSKIADVTIPCSAAGIEAGGRAVRMDGETVDLLPLVQSDRMPDEMIIKRIIEEIG